MTIFGRMTDFFVKYVLKMAFPQKQILTFAMSLTCRDTIQSEVQLLAETQTVNKRFCFSTVGKSLYQIIHDSKSEFQAFLENSKAPHRSEMSNKSRKTKSVSGAVHLAPRFDNMSHIDDMSASAFLTVETGFAVMHSKALAAADGHLGQNSRQPLPKQKACK